jgi:hypothetical protein
MKPLTRLKILVLFLILAGTRTGFAQRFDSHDKIYFADSVKTIKVWTYVEGDKSFRHYQEAINSTTVALNKKGYLVDIIAFETGKGIPAQIWENNIISELKNGEAFLEISTQIKKYDKRDRVNPSETMIRDEKGRDIFAQDWQGISRNSFVPVYSKTRKLESGDIYFAVASTLSDIPGSKHPAITTTLSDTIRNNKIPIEISLFGGYTFPSKMDILEESGSTSLYTAKFSGNLQYGLEIGFGITKSIDINIQYRRLGTVVDVNTPIQEKTGSLTINQNYMLAGTNFNFRVSKVISPYAGICLGALNMVPADNYFRDVWYFIIGVQGGTKFYISRRIGLRLQAEVLYQMHPQKAPFLYSDDATHNTPVDAMSHMLQVGLSAGFILRLGN